MRYSLKNWKKIKRGYKFDDKTFYSEHHLGTDYIVPKGTPVYAPKKCEIIVTGNFPEGGNTIHVALRDKRYGKLIMRCMHLQDLPAKGKFKAGEILAYTGNTGKYTKGPHLHIDISREKVDINNFSNFIDPDELFVNIKPSKTSK